MDERIETFMDIALSSEGTPQARKDVRAWLSSYERVFPDVGRASYRERVLEEIARRKGTPTEYHLRIVLAVIDLDASFRWKDE